MKILKPMLLAFSVLFTLTLFAQKKVELKYNLEEGKEYKSQISMVQTIAMEAQGQSMNMDQEIDFFIAYKVKEASKDSVKLSITFDRVKMNQKVMGMDMSYDSDSLNDSDPISAQIHEGFKVLLGKPIIQVIEPSGKIIRTDLGELANNAQFAQNVGNMGQYIIYPEGAIKVGESFEQDAQAFVQTGITTRMKYTLEKIENNLAIFKVEGKVSSEEVEGSAPAMEMDGTQTGTVKIDLKTGWQIGGEIEQQMEMLIQQAGMSIPAQVQGTIVYTSK